MSLRGRSEHPFNCTRDAGKANTTFEEGRNCNLISSIQGDTVRISSKDRDELQSIIALLRGKDLGVELQFTNYRTN